MGLAESDAARILELLVVDDDHRVRRLVRRTLEPDGFRVVEAADGAEALDALAITRPDVVVLDLHLPDISGLDVLRELRQRDTEAHVIMLTGAGGELDRVAGLSAGADDYVVKPFSMRELAARVGAVRRRRDLGGPRVVEVDELHLDRSGRQATVRGQQLELTRREFDLLHHLASHPGETFTRRQLLECVWGSSDEWQSPATVTEHIRRLRQKVELDPEHPAMLATARGEGYRFVTSASVPSALPPAAIDDRTNDATLVLVESVIVHATDEALAFLGAEVAGDVVGRPILDFVGAASLGEVVTRFRESVPGRSSRPLRTWARRLDGVEVPAESVSVAASWNGVPARRVIMFPAPDDDLAPIQQEVVGIAADAPDAVIITDAEHHIQRLNPAAEALFGWRETEVLGRVSNDVVPWIVDDDVRAEIRAAYLRDGRWHGVVQQRRRDGVDIPTRATVTLLRDVRGRTSGVAVVSRAADPLVVSAAQADPAPADLQRELRQAIAREQFVVHYQPIIRLSTGEVDGVEALVRWEHPELGTLAPGVFMEAAERSGAINDIGGLVLRDVCQQWSRWHAAGRDVPVAVNISGRELVDPELASRVEGALLGASMPGDQLWLEVTETSLVQDLSVAADTLRRIADLGVRVSIDDFGTGWASLTYLRRFPVHALKIDRSFVDGISAGGADAAIVRSVLRLAFELGLDVVAEGIEEEHQLVALRALGCELGQGYLLGRPGTAAELPPATP